jgi:glycosyltransferase involved in cell wall biosynthesis
MENIRQNWIDIKERWIWEYFYWNKILKREKIDLFFEAESICPTAKAIPRVTTCYDFIPLSFPKQYQTKKGFSGFRQRLQYQASLRGIRNSSHVLAISNFTRNQAIHYLRLDPANITTTHLGYASRDFRPVNDTLTFQRTAYRLGLQGPFGLYVGGADYRKNIPELIEAFIRYNEMNESKITLVIVGFLCSEMRKLKHRVFEKGLHHQIVFAGLLPTYEIVVLFNSALCFCFPSLEEGFGLPVIEAMACGLPVIAYHSEAVEEITKGAILLTKNLVKDFPLFIHQLASDSSLRNRLKADGLRIAANYSWKKTAEQTLSVFKRVVPGK